MSFMLFEKRFYKQHGTFFVKGKIKGKILDVSFTVEFFSAVPHGRPTYVYLCVYSACYVDYAICHEQCWSRYCHAL